DSHSLTASVVANPSHGTLSAFGTDGNFTYVPTTSYIGLDSFTYKINNGTYDSNVATVSIAVGGVFGPRTNLDDQPLDSPKYTGSTSTTTYTGYQAVVNRATSEYGKGWWLDGLDQLVTSGSGALLVRGNGDTLWFQDNSGTYAKAAGDIDFSTLVKNGNNT